MNFNRLSLSNFLSIQKAELDFTPGVHLIQGVNYDMGADGRESNGSGKSSLMEALLWVLFGQLNRGKAKEDDVINKAEGKNCKVEVEFTQDGQTFKIVRFRKVEGEGSGLRWWVDGKEQTAASTRDTQKDLENALPVSAQVFKYAVQVGQGMPDKFLDLPESAKQDLLCQMVDLTMYDRALDVAKGNIAELTTQATLAEGTIRGLAEQISKWEAELVSFQEALVSYESQTALDREKIQAEIDALNVEIVAKSEEADVIEAKAKAVPLEETLAPLRTQISEVNAHLERGRAAISKAQAEFYHSTAEAKKLLDAPTHCPTCKRPLDPTTGVTEHLEELGQKKDEAQASLDKYQGPFQKLKERKAELERKVSVAQHEVNIALGRTLELRQSATGLSRQRDTKAETLQSYQRQAANMRNRVEMTEGSIVKMRDSLGPNQDRLTALTRQKTHWTFWRDSLPNLRASAMEEVLGFLNDRLAYYMDIFSSGAMGVRLYQEAYGKGSKIKVELKTPAGTYEMSSGGEKRRVDLALYLALSDMLQASAGVQVNILAADEITDNLSLLGVRQLLDVLRQKAQNGLAVWVVSHNPAVTQSFEFDTVKTVERKGGRAQILQVEI